MTKDKVQALLKQLKEVDEPGKFKNAHHKGWREREEYVQLVMEELISAGSGVAITPEATDELINGLINILDNYDSWSCIFAAKILGEVGDERAIEPLIKATEPFADFLNEEAMRALVRLGKAAVPGLIKRVNYRLEHTDEVDKHGDKLSYISTLSALSRIKDEKVVNYLISLVERIGNDNDSAVTLSLCLGDQSDTRLILPLKRLIEMHKHDDLVVREAEASIEKIENDNNPEYQNLKKRLKTFTSEQEAIELGLDYEEKQQYPLARLCYKKILENDSSSYYGLFLIARLDRKTGFPTPFIIEKALEEAREQKASEEFLSFMEGEYEIIKEAIAEREKDFTLQFKCVDCGEIQTLKTGEITVITDKENRPEKQLFRNEIMCKRCNSHNLNLTKHGLLGIMSRTVFSAVEKDDNITFSQNKVFANNKKMKHSQVIPYFKKLIQKNPNTGIFRLKYANSLLMFNKYDEAIEQYEEAFRLNSKLIACPINLIRIFIDRFEEYNIKEAKESAEEYFKKLDELYEQGDYKLDTIKNKHFVSEVILDYREKLESLKESP